MIIIRNKGVLSSFSHTIVNKIIRVHERYQTSIALGPTIMNIGAAIALGKLDSDIGFQILERSQNLTVLINTLMNS